MNDTTRDRHVPPEAVGEESPHPGEPRRQHDAGKGFPAFLGTAAGIFSVVLVLLAIFVVVILLVS